MARLRAKDKAHLLLLADAHKEQIFSKLHELVPGRMARLDRSVFEGKTTEEVLMLIYAQGIAERHFMKQQVGQQKTRTGSTVRERGGS